MVGAFDGVKYHEEKLQLEKGEALVMFTDGVTEAMNEEHEEFGNGRLNDTLEEVTMHNCQQIIDSVKSDIKTFVGNAEQSDDITLLVIKRI
jgi:sigma-B regulation protein RsbU (phosphoserine phosphatase)